MTVLDLAPTLSPRFVVYLRDYLLDRRIDPRPILEHCGIDRIEESETALPVPTTRIMSLFDYASEVTGDPLLGHNIARNFHFESSAVIVLAFLAAPTVGEGLKSLSYFDKGVDSGIAITCSFCRTPASFSVGLLGIETARARHLNEYLITFTFHSLLQATRRAMPLREVRFQHAESGTVCALASYFKAPVVYERPENTLVFESEYLNQHLYTSNALLCQILRDALSTYFCADQHRHGFVDSVCRELMRQSEVQDIDLGFVADALAMSTRTVRRRLQEAGVTFQQVKSIARERQTKYFLANTDKTLTEIAFLLGYSDPSSFSRAFKKWTGNTPLEFRSKARRLISG